MNDLNVHIQAVEGENRKLRKHVEELEAQNQTLNMRNAILTAQITRNNDTVDRLANLLADLVKPVPKDAAN